MNIDDTLSLIKAHPYYKNKPCYYNANSFFDYPILTKNDVVRNWMDFSVDKPGLYCAYTSGSTGIPLKIFWDRIEYLQSMACLWRLRKKHGISSTDFYLTCHNSAMLDKGLCTDAIILNKNFVSFSKLHSGEEIYQEYANYIKIFKPAWIYAQPSFVYQLGLYLQSQAPELLRIFKYIELVGEMIDPVVKDSIQLLFENSTIVSMYGMQEFNCIMYETDGVMQVCNDNVFVEILDKDGKPCKAGEEGDIIVTGLKNSVFPLIRYKTEDRGMFECRNNKIGYIITKGKANDSFSYNGKIYDGSIFFHVILKYNLSNKRKISKFQIIQKKEALYFYLLSLEELPSESKISEDIARILQNDFDIFCNVIVKNVKNFSEFIHGTSKTKYFIKKDD